MPRSGRSTTLTVVVGREDYESEIEAAWARVVYDCGCQDLYYCPNSVDIECPRHSGFTTCCARPDRHVPVR